MLAQLGLRRWYIAPIGALALSISSVSSAAPIAQKIHWLDSRSDAFALSAKSGKPIFIEGWADWCEPCLKMDRDVYSNSSLIAEIKENWIALRIDLSNSMQPGEQFGFSALPVSQITNGKEEFGYRIKVEGYVKADVLLNQLKMYRNENL